MDNSTDKYLKKWNGRLRAAFVDFIVLALGAYSAESVYPYSVHQYLSEIWDEDLSPPLPTIYSTIDRLERENLIEISQEISGGRAQKTITTTPMGFEAMEKMKADFQDVTVSTQKLLDKFGMV